MAGSDTIDPANPCMPYPRPRRPADDGGTGFPYCRDLPARELDEGIAVVEEYPLRRRTAVNGKVRVLIP